MSEQNRTVEQTPGEWSAPGTETVHRYHSEANVVVAGDQPIEQERPEDWGWHGGTGRWGRVGAWIAVLITLSLLIGNHEGRVEDLWVISFAGIMVVILLLDWRRRKNAWRSE